MSTVKCSLGDAPQPKGELPVLRLGAPFALQLKNEESIVVKTGVTFDVPVLVFGFEGTARQNVKLLNAGTLVLAGQEVVAHLESVVPKIAPDAVALFERGDSLLCVVTLPRSEGLELKLVP